MEFSRQEYWSGLPFPPPGDLPNPGIKPVFPALQVDFFFFFFYYLSHQGAHSRSSSQTAYEEKEPGTLNTQTTDIQPKLKLLIPEGV